jgi:hypothetical protein
MGTAPGTGTGWTFPTHEKPVPAGRVRWVGAGFFFVTESYISPLSPLPPPLPPSANDQVIHKSPSPSPFLLPWLPLHQQIYKKLSHFWVLFITFQLVNKCASHCKTAQVVKVQERQQVALN